MSRVALAPLRHPALWAWPLAAWLTLHVSRAAVGPDNALQYYYLPALGLVLLGCLPSVFLARPPERRAAPPFASRRALGWVTAALLVGAVGVRLWKLWYWPPNGIGFEEFQIAGRAPLADWVRNFLFLYAQPGEHTLTAYAISLSFSFFGTGFLQMRLPFIIGGMLAPLLLYAVCRRLVSWEVTLFAVALFAVSWWEIAASRVADEIFFPMWIELAILWLLLEFEDTGRSLAAYLLALLSGLLIYEYTSYHLVVFMVMGYLLARALWFIVAWPRAPQSAAERRRRLGNALRVYAPGAVAMILVWTIVAHFQLADDLRNGMGSWFAGGVGGHQADPDGLLAQLSTPSALPAFLVRKLGVPIRAAYLPGQGDFCRHLGIGGAAAFDRATAFCMGVGFVLVALTFRRRFHALALVWATIIISGAALLPANANIHRYYVGLPFYYLIIALGAEVLWRWVQRPAARRALLGAFAVIVAYAAIDNLHHLFWELVPDQTLRANWIWPRTEVVNWIRRRQPGDWVCVVGDDDLSIYGANPLQQEWRWLLHGWNVRVSPTGADCIPAPADAHGPLYYVFTLAHPPTDLEALLRTHYPDAIELDRIEVPQYQFVARTFSVPASGAAGGK